MAKKKLTYGRNWKAKKEGTFGQRLSYWILKRDVKLVSIRLATGISEPSISLWANDKVIPQSDNLRKLCNFLKIEEKWLDAEFSFKDLK